MKYGRWFGLLFGLLPALAAPAAESPNIIVIYADDIGYGDFSCYGGTGVRTPNVDRLAQGGIRFLSGYASAATCTPSRYSLLTGEYAFRNKSAKILPGNAPLIIDVDQPTLASFLKGAGYRTALVGKWHLGLGRADAPMDWNGPIRPGPRQLGFDEAYYMAATADRVPSVFIENEQVVNLDPTDPISVSYKNPVGSEPTGTSNPEMLRVQADAQHSGTIVNGISRIGTMSGGQSARFRDEAMSDTFLEKAIEFIEKKDSKPFFLYYAGIENHVPRAPHPRFIGASSLGPRGDAIVQFDWNVGRIVETLRSCGLLENTLIILSSDNGPVLFDGYWDGAIEHNGTHRAAGPWRGGKYSRWEGGTRMPFVVSWPGRVKPGTSDALVSQVDVFKSIAALVGKNLPENASPDGENVLPALLGESPHGRDYVVEEALAEVAIRKGDWKYIPPGTVNDRGGLDEWRQTIVKEPGLLFDLANDPGEKTDLAGKHPSIVRELRGLLEEIAPEKFKRKRKGKGDKSQRGF